jgi:hypothetical protein
VTFEAPDDGLGAGREQANPDKLFDASAAAAISPLPLRNGVAALLIARRRAGWRPDGEHANLKSNNVGARQANAVNRD